MKDFNFSVLPQHCSTLCPTVCSCPLHAISCYISYLQCSGFLSCSWLLAVLYCCWQTVVLA